jgi:hypothetical protein
MGGAGTLAMWGWVLILNRKRFVLHPQMSLMARRTVVLADTVAAGLYHTSIDLAGPAVPGLVEPGIGIVGLGLGLELVGQDFCEVFCH